MKSFFGGSTQQRQDTMFSATATKTPEPALATPRGKTQMPSIFSTDLKITGDLIGDGEMQIDGHVDGNVKSAAVVIGKLLGATVVAAYCSGTSIYAGLPVKRNRCGVINKRVE